MSTHINEPNVDFISSTLNYSKKRKVWAATAKFQIIGVKQNRDRRQTGQRLVAKNAKQFKVKNYFRTNAEAINWLITMRYTDQHDDIFNENRYKFLVDDQVLVKKAEKQWKLISPDNRLVDFDYDLSHIDFGFFTNPEYVAFNMAFRTHTSIRTAVKSNVALKCALEFAAMAKETPTRSEIVKTANMLESQCEFTDAKKFSESSDFIGENFYRWKPYEYYLVKATIANYSNNEEAWKDWRLLLEYYCTGDNEYESDSDADNDVVNDNYYFKRWFRSKDDAVHFLRRVTECNEFAIKKSDIVKIAASGVCDEFDGSNYNGLFNTEMVTLKSDKIDDPKDLSAVGRQSESESDLDKTLGAINDEAEPQAKKPQKAQVILWTPGKYTRGALVKHHDNIWLLRAKHTYQEPPQLKTIRNYEWELVGVNTSIKSTMAARSAAGPDPYYGGSIAILNGNVWEAVRQTNRMPPENETSSHGHWDFICSLNIKTDDFIPSWDMEKSYEAGDPAQVGNCIWVSMWDCQTTKCPPVQPKELKHNNWLLLCVYDESDSDGSDSDESDSLANS